MTKTERWVLFDVNHLARQPAQEGQVTLAYCALVGCQPLGLDSRRQLNRPLVRQPLLFYHSALISGAQGSAYGTLCHYDWQRCQERTNDQPLLEAAAALLYQQLHPSGSAQL